jgi:dTDP-4-dehydrorhamnose reductase
MKLLITGGGGFVAGSIIAQAAPEIELHALSRHRPEGLPGRVHFHTADITDFDAITELLNLIRPDAIIHTAAMANIDVCQKEPEQARLVNTDATKHLADQSVAVGAKLVFCSTDTVFEGTKGMYTEEDEPRGVNVYAETKIAAEQAVLAASKRHAVARLSLVMGLPVIGSGNSFLADLIRKLAQGQTMHYPFNEIRTPIDVITLGAALLELSGNDVSGIIHLAGNTRIDRYTMGGRIADYLNLPADQRALISGTDSNAIAGRARRPNDASMDNGRARRLLNTPMKSLEEGLQLVMHNPWTKNI